MLFRYAVKIFQTKDVQIEKCNCNILSNSGENVKCSQVLQGACIFEPPASGFEKKCVRFIFQRLGFTFLLQRGEKKKLRFSSSNPHCLIIMQEYTKASNELAKVSTSWVLSIFLKHLVFMIVLEATQKYYGTSSYSNSYCRSIGALFPSFQLQWKWTKLGLCSQLQKLKHQAGWLHWRHTGKQLVYPI